MKNRRIWLVILCILVVGVLVTKYTNSVISSRESKQEMAGVPETVNNAGGKADEAAAGQAEGTRAGGGGTSETTAQAAAPAMAAAGESRDQSGRALPQEESVQADAQATSAEAEAAAAPQEAAPASEIAEAETAAGPGAGPGARARTGPGAGPGAAEGESSSMPASPLEGANGQAEYTTLSPDTDYRQRLVDLDNQIQKLREEDKDSSAYSLKAAAESELKLWEGEMNIIYNALLDALDQDGAASLAAEQQEWMRNREARAVENNAKNNAGSLEGVGVTASLTALTRSRAYDLVDRYEELRQGKLIIKQP
ncbi:MAG: DUF1311 domain-containing protein [Enterocloster asparagiformis]|nr:DUF1311 domain-containing protein [Enterocloster asparagiformis]